MRRRIFQASLLALAAFAALPGCAISLFSDHDAFSSDEDLTRLEKRMDRIEAKLPR